MLMASDAAGAQARPSLLRLIVAVAAGVLLAWLVVRSAAVNALLDQDLAAAAAVSPGNPRVVLAQADAVVRRERGPVAQAALDRAFDAAQGAPLGETPFLLAGANALRAGDGDRAERLLVEAKERNPRSRTARFLLLEHHVRAGKPAAAAQEMAALTRLMPDARPVLIAGLARFAASMPDNGAIAEVLKGDPAVRHAVLEHLAASAESPELIMTLSNGARPMAGARWPEAVIAALIERGEVRRAYAAWRRFSGFPAGAASAGVFNGGFEDLPAAPPFNWLVESGEAGSAELGNGLRIAYPGEARAQFARQLLLLPPGSYRLSYEAKGESAAGGSGLEWTLTCHGSGARLASLRVNPSAVIAQSNEAQFTVPGGCSAQWLSLIGVPGQETGISNLIISDLEIAGSDEE